MTLSNLITQRAALVEDARGRLDEIRACNDPRRLNDLEAAHDSAMADLDAIDARIARESKLANIAQRSDESMATNGAGDSVLTDRRPHATRASVSGTGDSYWQTRSGWADRQGNDVRVLARDDRMAIERAEGVTLGDTLRALVTGARNDVERRALAEGTDSAGGYTVPTPLAQQFIDKLRRQSVAIRAGAMTVPMTTETLGIARLETDPTIAWRAENAAVAEGDPTFARVTFEAKSLAGMVKVSRELVDDSTNISLMLENAFTQAMALELDRAAIFGDGSSNSPIGVIGTSGINEVSMGTNGAALANYDKLIDTIYEMMLDNAGDATAAILHPRTMAALAKLKDSQNNPLTVPELVRRIPMLATTAASIAETQGTSNAASSIVFGDFTQLMIGMRSDIRIEVLRERYAENHQFALVAHMRADVQLAHAASFARLKGITA